MFNVNSKMYTLFQTLTIINITLILIPTAFLSYLLLKLLNKFWHLILSIWYPDVDFITKSTIRSILDTHRNQGIISVLLYVKGAPQFDAVHSYFNEVVRRRTKLGQLMFPRLRHCLVKRCGWYGWQVLKFDLDQNVLLAPPTYKGRPISEYNIQECVSDIVSKYLPAGVPPWQVIVIPTQEDYHYILLKVHHILLDGNLKIGDLLPVVPPTKAGSKTAMLDVMPSLRALPQLRQAVSKELANLWNEFLARFDPLEQTGLKRTPGVFEYCAIVLIAASAAFKKTPFLLKCELGKRGIGTLTILKSLFISLNPKNTLSNLWHLPLFVCRQTCTICGYFPLLRATVDELLQCATKLAQTPQVLIGDILLAENSFQTLTLCGRKSVAWSEPVKTDLIRNMASNSGYTETDILLTLISACISRYLVQTKCVIPDCVPTVLRHLDSSYIFAVGSSVQCQPIGGILCLNLPAIDPERDESIMANLCEVSDRFQNVLERQSFVHLLSGYRDWLCQVVPPAVLGVCLRYLSRKYTVSVTEISGRYSNIRQKTLWGQEVSSVVFWRPPQANSSVSLCLNEYGDCVRLGVMADAQLAPHHQIMVRGFPDLVNELFHATDLF